MSTAASTTTSSSKITGMREYSFIVIGLLGVQVMFSVYGLFLHRVLLLGIKSLSLVIFGGYTSIAFLLPFALILEKKKWPTSLKPTLMIHIFLLSIVGGGVTAWGPNSSRIHEFIWIVFQLLMLVGMEMTSPALASAMPNLGPAITFIIATCAKFERFSIWCKYSRAKIIGTILCLSGAMAMSLLMNPLPSNDTTILPLNNNWILGCLYFFLAICLTSCVGVWQAHIMIGFPAPFSLCIIGTLISSTFTAMIQFILEGNLNVGAPSLSSWSVVGVILLSASVTSISAGYLTWCVKRIGPVMVSIFTPLQTMCSTVLTAITLQQILGPGCLSGMLLMFIGLYIVLWAKKKEYCKTQITDNEEIHTDDIEKPLLS